MKWAIATAVLPLLAAGSGCHSATPHAPPDLPPPPPAIAASALLELSEAPKLPAWTYWEPVELPLVDLPAERQSGPNVLPLDEAAFVRTPGAEILWVTMPQAFRDAVLTRGFAVTRALHPSFRLGEFYGALRDARIPFAITLDALFFLAHLAIDRALAAVDSDVIAPSARTLLGRFEVRLASDGRGARADIAPSYLLARTIVSVALSLAVPDYQVPPDLATLVDRERGRILAHAGVATSPALGVLVDYGSMTPRGMADRDSLHAGRYRAEAWLEQTGLVLEGAGEGEVRSQVDVWVARVHSRAALLLSRLLEYDVDAEAAVAWARIDRAGELLVGRADDPTPRDIAAATVRANLDLRNRAWFVNVALVDRIRHAAARAQVSRIHDGWGGATVLAGMVPSVPLGLLSPNFRLLGPRVTPDAEVLQSLVFPFVGPSTRTDPPATASDGRRALPTALDVAAWLGSGEARAALHESGDDAYERYPEMLERRMQTRPSESSLERHRTPFQSFIDALETWIAPSMGDRAQPASSTSEWRKRKAEVALAAWTEWRHDATTLSRLETGEVRLPDVAPTSSVPIFVEPHPEAIAKLLALVRQTSRALVAEGVLRSGSSALAVLDEVVNLLWVSLGAAVYEANDEALPLELQAALAAVPARMRALEAALSDAGAVDVPIAIDVHVDTASRRVLEESVGPVDEAWIVMREPVAHRLWLAVGASIPHYEATEDPSKRWTDTSWRSRLSTDGAPPPGTLERSYLVDR